MTGLLFNLKMISIVIPLYNKEKSIASTLQTVLNQTFSDYEIVIVNDGSTDNSVAEVEKVQDSRVRLIHQQNAGVSAARNRGIKEAMGELIAFLDADDEWMPEYLATQIQLYHKYSDCKVFACNYKFRNADGTISPTNIRNLPFREEDGILSNYFVVASCSHPPLWTSAVMVKKQAMQAIGGFPLGIKSGEDLLTWARLAVNGMIAYSKRPLAVFIFDERIFNADQKQRMPESVDVVGNELFKLYKANPGIVGIKQYVGLWHKMRARIFLSKHLRWRAFYECVRAIQYHVSVKILVFLILSLMPYRIVDFILKK